MVKRTPADTESIRPGLDEIIRASQLLSRHISPSPLILNPWLSEEMGCEVYLKLENMQPVGSFKVRGATYRISQLTDEEKAKGVIAASAGNHSQGVAWGARKFGVKAKIVMPENAPLVKIANTQALGASVILHGESYDDAYEKAREVADAEGLTFVHAFEDRHVIAGQGTCGLEIIDQLPEVDAVIASMGGGGLMSGVSTVFRALRPEARIIAVQSAGVPALVESLRAGKIVEAKKTGTFADGIAVGKASEKIRALLQDQVDDLLLASEEEIASAVLSLVEKAKVVAEGSAAISLSALQQLKSELKGKKVVLIVCGGNIDVNLVSRIIDRGLIAAGRRVRVNVLLDDRPGGLLKLTELLAAEKVNILQAIHDRSRPAASIDRTEIQLTLETNGPAHRKHVIDSLREHVYAIESLEE